MRFRACQKVRALDFVIIEVNNLVQTVEVSGSVSHNHDYIGPVHYRPVTGQRDHSWVLIHPLWGFPVRVGMMVAMSLEAL